MTIVKYYTLLDCNCDTPYLNSLGEQIWFKAMGPVSPDVSAVGGLSYFNDHILTEIKNDQGVIIATGCLSLTQVPYDPTVTYTIISEGLYSFFTTDTCIQCKFASCSDTDDLSVERVNCMFGNAVYAQMLDVRYGLETCCEEDLQKWSIKKELIDFDNMKQGYLVCPNDATGCSTTCNQPVKSCNNCSN